MADIFTGKLFKLLINKDAGNTLPNGTEITNIASLPTLQINSQALQYETYESEFNTYLLSSKSIGAFDITVSYIPDNATHKLLDSYTDSRDEFQVILNYQEVDNRVTYAIVSGRITGASVSGSKDSAVTKAYHFAPEVEVVTLAAIVTPQPLMRGDYGVGSNTTDVAQYQPTTPAGNSFIKVPAAQTGNPAGADLLGIANVDGTAVTEFAMTKSGSLSLYAKNQSTAWTRIYTATQMDDRYVQRTVTVNGKQLTGNITLNSNDVGALPKTGGILTGNLSINNSATGVGSYLDVGSEQSTNYSRITLARQAVINGKSAARVANLKITPEGYLQFGIQSSVNQNAPDKFMMIDDSKISFTGPVVFNSTYQGDEAPIDLGGTTTDLNTLMIGGALADNPGAKRTYICTSTGGGANITNVPPGVSGNFFLEVIATRKANATDYNGFQQLYSGDTKKVFRRFYNRVSTTTFTDWAEVSSGVQTIALGGTGATDAAGARKNLGAVNIAGDTMLGNLAINTPGSADASLTFNANKSGVRGNNTGDIVVFSSPGRSIHLRPNGDVNDENITKIDSNGLVSAKTVVITASQPTQGNALTRKDYVDGLISQQVSKAGDTMTGNLTISTPGNADASLILNGKAGVRANSNGDLVVYSSDTRSIYFRPQGDMASATQVAIDKTGTVSALNLLITSPQGTQSNAATRKDYVDSAVQERYQKIGGLISGNVQIRNPATNGGSFLDVGSETDTNYSRITLARQSTADGSKVANLKITPEGYVQFGIQNTVGQSTPDKYMLITKDNISFTGPTIFSTNYQGDEAPVSIADQTLDLNTVVMGGNYSDNAGSTRNYICQSSGGGSKITNKPSGVSGNFYLQVIGTRRVSNTDYAGFQQLYSSDTGKVYRRRYIGDGNGIRFSPDWEEVTSGVQTISNGGTGATTAAAALSSLGGLPLAGGTMTGDLALSTAAAGQAKITIKNSVIRSSTDDALVISAKGQSIHIRPNGDTVATNALVVPASGPVQMSGGISTGAVGASSVTSSSDIVSSNGNIATTSDNSMIRVGNNGDLALLKKGSNNGKIVVGSNTPFVIAKSNQAKNVNPTDTLTDLFTIGSNGDVATTGNLTVNGDVVSYNLNTATYTDTAVSVDTGQIKQRIFSADGKTERLFTRMYGDIRTDSFGYATIGVKRGTNNEVFFSFQENGDFTSPRNVVARNDVWAGPGYSLGIGTGQGGNKDVKLNNQPNDAQAGWFINNLNGRWYNDSWDVGGVRGSGTDLDRVQINVSSNATNQYASYLFLSNGTAQANNWLSLSDIRIKDNVQKISDPLGKMKQLSGCSWTLKTNGKYGMGFIAQEIETVFPGAVNTTESYKVELPDGTEITDLKSVDVSGVAGALHHEAILALMAKVEALEAKLAALTGEAESTPQVEPEVTEQEPVQDTETTPEANDEQSQADDTQNK